MQNSPLEIFKALGDPTRFAIVSALARRGEMSCQSLSKKFRLSQPTVSHHFHQLVRAGIIRGRKHGVRCSYRLHTAYLRRYGIHFPRPPRKK